VPPLLKAILIAPLGALLPIATTFDWSEIINTPWSYTNDMRSFLLFIVAPLLLLPWYIATLVVLPIVSEALREYNNAKVIYYQLAFGVIGFSFPRYLFPFAPFPSARNYFDLGGDVSDRVFACICAVCVATLFWFFAGRKKTQFKNVSKNSAP